VQEPDSGAVQLASVMVVLQSRMERGQASGPPWIFITSGTAETLVSHQFRRGRRYGKFSSLVTVDLMESSSNILVREPPLRAIRLKFEYQFVWFAIVCVWHEANAPSLPIGLDFDDSVLVGPRERHHKETALAVDIVSAQYVLYFP
jgi:hypothetical protein